MPATRSSRRDGDRPVARGAGRGCAGRLRRHRLPPDRPHRRRRARAGRSGRLQVVANAAVGYDNIDVVDGAAAGASPSATRPACSTTPRPTWRSSSSWRPPVVDRGRARPAAGPLEGLGFRHPPGPRRPRRHARAGRLRAHRPGGGPTRRRLRHGGPPHRPQRHRPARLRPDARRAAGPVGHRQPARAADRVHPPSHRRGGAGPHEADRRPRSTPPAARSSTRTRWSTRSRPARSSAPGSTCSTASPTVNPRLLSAPRTTLLPHIGSATIATRTRMARLACQGVCRRPGGQDAAEHRAPGPSTQPPQPT